jgi:hypothetical protein
MKPLYDQEEREGFNREAAYGTEIIQFRAWPQ